MGVEAEPRWGTMPERPWDTSVWVADSGRLERKLGWRAEVELETGLLQTVEWLRDTPGMLEFYRAGQERSDRRLRVPQDSAAMTRSPTCSGPIPCRA